MPTPGGRFMNWINLTFTPTGGTAITILGVTNVAYDPQAKVITGAGDGDMGPTSINLTETDPKFTIDLEHLAIMRTLTPGLRGSFSGTFMDAENGVSSGAMIFTVANAIVENFTIGGKFRAYGSGSLHIRTWSPDGITPPVSIGVAA